MDAALKLLFELFGRLLLYLIIYPFVFNASVFLWDGLLFGRIIFDMKFNNFAQVIFASILAILLLSVKNLLFSFVLIPIDIGNCRHINNARSAISRIIRLTWPAMILVFGYAGLVGSHRGSTMTGIVLALCVLFAFKVLVDYFFAFTLGKMNPRANQ